MTSAIVSCLDYGICGFNGTKRHLSSSLPIQNLVQVVEMQSQELLYCVLEPNTKKVRHLNQIQWLKPLASWHKLNTDGSVVSTNGLSGCGGAA